MQNLQLKEIVEMEIVNHFRSTRKKSYIQQSQYDAELGFWRGISTTYIAYNASKQTEAAIIKELNEKKRAGFEAKIAKTEQEYASVRVEHTPFACFEKLSKISKDIRRRYGVTFPDAAVSEQVRATLQSEHEAHLKEMGYVPPEPHVPQPRPVNTPDKLQDIIDWRASAEAKTSVDEVLAILKPFDELVVRLCYGLGEPVMSMADIGREFGGKSKQFVSGARMERIKQQALNNLYHNIIPAYCLANGADRTLVDFIHYLKSDNAVYAYNHHTYLNERGVELLMYRVRRRSSLQVAAALPAHLTARGAARDTFDGDAKPLLPLLPSGIMVPSGIMESLKAQS